MNGFPSGGGGIKVNGEKTTAKCVNAINKGDICEFIPNGFEINDALTDLSKSIIKDSDWTGSYSSVLMGGYTLRKVVTSSGELYLAVYRTREGRPNDWVAALYKFSKSGVSVVGTPVTFISGHTSLIGDSFTLFEIAPNSFMFSGVYSPESAKFYYNFMTVNKNNTITVSGGLKELSYKDSLTGAGYYAVQGVTSISTTKIAVVYKTTLQQFLVAIFSKSGNTLTRVGTPTLISYPSEHDLITDIIRVEGNGKFVFSHKYSYQDWPVRYRQKIYLVSVNMGTNLVDSSDKVVTIKEDDGRDYDAGWNSSLRLYKTSTGQINYISAQRKINYPGIKEESRDGFFFFGGRVDTDKSLNITIPEGGSINYVNIFNDNSINMDVLSLAATEDYMIYCGENYTSDTCQMLGYCQIDANSGNLIPYTARCYISESAQWVPTHSTMIDSSGIYSIRSRTQVYRIGISTTPAKVKKVSYLTPTFNPCVALNSGNLNDDIQVVYRK